MDYLLFLDDQRVPKECRHYPGDESEYDTQEWTIVRSFEDFCNVIKTKGLPVLVSFDYDLGDSKDGLDCAMFLKDYCKEQNLKIPEYLVHSKWPGIRGNFYEILDSQEA